MTASIVQTIIGIKANRYFFILFVNTRSFPVRISTIISGLKGEDYRKDYFPFVPF